MVARVIAVLSCSQAGAGECGCYRAIEATELQCYRATVLVLHRIVLSTAFDKKKVKNSSKGYCSDIHLSTVVHCVWAF